jgi:hypothetical protein
MPRPSCNRARRGRRPENQIGDDAAHQSYTRDARRQGYTPERFSHKPYRSNTLELVNYDRNRLF